MNRQVKRYAIISDNWDYVESPTGGFIDRDDFAALEAECDALWSTYVALVDKLGIDTEKAKTADGKPSDVIVSYVDALRAENDRLRKALEHCSEVMKDPWKHGARVPEKKAESVRWGYRSLGYAEGWNACVDAMLAAPANPAERQEQEECCHEFVPFQSSCAKCGEPYDAAERQEQGEVQRLREVLEHCSEVMKDPWKHGEGCISRAINRADAALANSTGQEMEKQ